jgi:hypothetical protein
MLADSSYNVIYVFLVAETPTLGVDGFQLQNAFAYEAELESALSGHGKFGRGRNGTVAIVGPQYSGSAASLRAGIEAAWTEKGNSLGGKEFEVTGTTATSLSANLLTFRGLARGPTIRYLSFSSNGHYDDRILLARLLAGGYDLRRATLLIEDNTTLGRAVTLAQSNASKGPEADVMQVIRFPRDISLLRNAQATEDQYDNQAVPSGSIRSPYLRFSLKDPSGRDSVPQFSLEHTPLSQEAQLMTIARQLHRYRSQFIGIVASNVLDQAFLAQFLHRACPDARLVFFRSDLLMVREVDNVPFIGSITITPYPLIGLGGSDRTYASSSSEEYYNAFTYTLWDRSLWPSKRILSVDHPGPAGDPDRFGALLEQAPHVQGYRNLLNIGAGALPVNVGAVPRQNVLRPSLWATAIGSDGYYPLAIISPCASNLPQFLPAIHRIDGTRPGDLTEPENCAEPEPAPVFSRLTTSTIYPSRLWLVLCTVVFLLCFLHVVILSSADYWSPFTRDLAIRDNDEPLRRSTYVHVAAAVLFSMAFAVSFPALALHFKVPVNLRSILASVVTLGIGIWAVIATLCKTWGYIGWKPPNMASRGPAGFQRAYDRVRANACFFLNLVAGATLVGVPFLWGYICLRNWAVGSSPENSVYFGGASFAYRCIHPSSGVSPIVPVLLLLFGWYLWAFCQTRRLRFSDSGRPRLPQKLGDERDGRLFVSDHELDSCKSPRDCCLYDNITCLLITQRVLRRSRKFRDYRGDIILGVVFGGFLVWFCFFTPVQSLDHFLWNTGKYLSSPYEFLVGVLFFPLIVACLGGWLRIILIWAALKRGLLERLENLPIRFAFSRLKVMGWLTMLSQSGLREQWRDMARCVESMRQMLHQDDLKESMPESELLKLGDANAKLLKRIRPIRLRIANPAERPKFGKHDYDFMKRIELGLAAFSQALLEAVLIPYWKNGRTGLVESAECEELPIKARRSPMQVEHPYVPMELRAGPASSEPTRILVAEEFVAIRYMSLVRAVLANMRYLMLFVSSSFVLAIVAWNSYPFQPRRQVDWLFTGLLVLLGSGIIWVLAQMHRDSILSRITDTKENELGWDFYVRVISFGAFPVLAWLAYQFPDIGSVISKFLQPAVPVVK